MHTVHMFDTIERVYLNYIYPSVFSNFANHATMLHY